MLQLIPYPELRVEWVRRESGDLNISTPWISVSGRISSEHLNAIDETLLAIIQFRGEHRQRLLVDFFLKQFIEYPLFHVQPRPLADFKKREPRPVSISSEYADFGVSSQSSDLGLNWRHETVLEESWISDSENLFDPLSVITSLRRLRLEATSSNSKIQDEISSLEKFKKEQPESFIHKAKSILEHSLFVTTHAVPTLKQGVGLNPDVDPLLTNFITSEMGHEQHVLKSLAVLGGPRPDWETLLFQEVRTLIDLLGTAARTSSLALAVIIDGFEGTKYDREAKSIWDLVDNIAGFSNASRGVRDHQRINDSQNHSNVSLDIAAVLTPISMQEVAYVFQLAVAAESTRQRLFGKLYSSTGLA